MAYFVFCSKMESGYLWYYFYENFDLFKDIFNHLIKKHNAETFKIKKLKFCEKEGVLGYTTVYWRRVSGVSKRVFATIKSKPMPAKLQTQYCYLHYNVFRRKHS